MPLFKKKVLDFLKLYIILFISMLIISRRRHESFMIDEDINIKVMNISKGKVKIGIDAHDKKVMRSELKALDQERDVLNNEDNGKKT